MDNLTIVIPYRDERAALSRLLRTLPTDIPVIVVDDQSDTPPVGTGRETILRLKERGYFSGAVNAGIQACQTDVLVLNQDTWVERPDWLDWLEPARAHAAMIGMGVMDHPAWPNGYVQGICMFMRRDAIRKVGLLNRKHWPLWGATAEWQLRACRAGFQAQPLFPFDWLEHERKGKFGASISQTLKEQPSKHDLLIRTPPLISVVTACCNYGRYLPDLVASLTGGKTSLGPMPGQTFQGFELVIVDDASTDDSLAVAQSLASPWKGIRVLARKERGGTAIAMNDGVRASYGRWIMAIDSDDMLEPETLETLLAVVEEDEYAVPYPDQRLFAKGKRGGHQKLQDYDFDGMLNANMVPAGILYARSGFEAAGGYPPAFADGRQDWAFAAALGAVGYCGKRISKPLYLYRREGQNRTLMNTNPNARGGFLRQMIATFPDLYKGERPMGCCGGGARRAQQRAVRAGAAPATAKAMPGVAGMEPIEYIGENVGRSVWRGEITLTRYMFSGSQRVKLVDKRDVPGLLDEVYDYKPAFRRYVPPAPKHEIAPVPEPTELVAPEAVPEPEPVADAPEAEVMMEPEIGIGPRDAEVAAAVAEDMPIRAEAPEAAVADAEAKPKRKYTRRKKEGAALETEDA